MSNYDVVIVGAGPAGIFAAYELSKKNKDLKVALVDKGLDIYKRRCPILEHKIKKCPVIKDHVGCMPACSITNGFGGAGAYSDGKFNITHEFGGWMTDYLSNGVVEDLISYVDEINLEHGATTDITDPTTDKVREIEKRGYAVGLKLLRAKVRHLGTEQNLEILKSIYEAMKDRVDYHFKTEVKDVIVEDNEVKGLLLANGETMKANQVFLAPGRDGSVWLKDVMKGQNIPMKNLQVDIGVRVETSDIVMQEINEHLYEGKFVYRTSVGTVVRTFCSNPSGHVVVENHSGTHEVSHLANKLSNGSIIVQKYGDILRGRRTTAKRLKEGFVEPTLKEAVPGDLGLVLPYNTMKSLIEMTEALDHVTPGIAAEHTLFYGVEAKFYSARPEIDDKFETKVKGLFVGGDGAGVTRGLAQAGASGVWVARQILERYEA